MKVKLKPAPISKSLVVITSLLLVANIIAIYLKLTNYTDPESWRQKQDFLRVFINLFDFDTEGNFPSMFSSLNLLFCSILLFINGLAHNRKSNNFYSWMGLSAIFLFLSVDEMISLHERLTSITKNFVDASGFLFNAWVIPYGIALVIVAVLYFRFLFRLPRNILILFIISFLIFATGAVGFEMIEGSHYEVYGETPTLYYSVLYTIEETLEMLGIILFIYALLSYRSFAISIKLKPANGTQVWQ